MERLPRYWSRADGEAQAPSGRTYALRRWGWSVSSTAQAAALAAQRLGELTQSIRAGREPGRETYYPRTPLREEVIEEVLDSGGTLIAAITRNRYGALVLNTAAVLIADVDLPRQSLGGLLKRLFSRGEDPALAQAVERIEAFAAAHHELSVHTYRTAAGLRVLITGSGAAPQDEAATEILQALASDPLYVRLCVAHRTYRARLTPKPWRVGLTAPAGHWPFEDDSADRAYREWIERYSAASANARVCEKLASTQGRFSEAERRIVQLHDQYVLRGAGSRLA